MGLGDVWNRTLVYFGIAEEEDWDEDGYVTEEELERTYSDRPNVRRLAPRRAPRTQTFDDWTDPEPEDARTHVQRPRPRGLEAVPGPASVRVHLVVPRSFNDAQQIADKFKDGIPVILNLQSSDQDLSKRLNDIGSFVYVFIVVYTILILAYIITSWVRLPYSPWLNRVQRFLYDVCEPYLRLFRRILPTIGPLDLSPIVGIAFLYLIR